MAIPVDQGSKFESRAKPERANTARGKAMPRPIIVLANQRFGRWLVTGLSHMGRHNHAYWRVYCDCGVEGVVRGDTLTRGYSTSCGCLAKEINRKLRTTHGQSGYYAADRSREYVAWVTMIQRCENPKTKGYHRYGGRGITVCGRWRNSFEMFLADMGLKPTPRHSVDRWPNNNGDYEPGNCRWATQKEQIANRDPGSIVNRRAAADVSQRKVL